MSLQCHGINLKFLHVQNRIYIKFKIKLTVTHAYINVETTAIQAYRRLHKRRFDDCTSVDSTVARAPIRRLHRRRIDVCTRVQLAILQASIWQFRKRRFDDCTSLDSTVAQALFWRLYKRWIINWTSVESTVTIVEVTVIIIVFKKVLRFLDVPLVPR